MMADGSCERHSTPMSSPRFTVTGRSYHEFVMIGLGCLALLGFGYGMGSSNFSNSVSSSSSYSVSSKRPSRPTLMETSPALYHPMFQDQGETAEAASSDTRTSHPKLAWLMSFPNSGTSFTSKMVRHYSMTSTATNYGEEYLDPNTGESIGVIPNSTTPPFWIGSKMHPDYTRPTNFILTKTHCGGRCEKCGPDQFIETPHSFEMRCRQGRRMVSKNGVQEYVKRSTYDAGLVHKAVHLIRSPFDNVVSRFHLEHHHYVEQDDASKLAAFPANRTGFRAFCAVLDSMYTKQEVRSRLMDNEVLDLIKDVPCHLDFLRFTAWHNHAFCTTLSMGIPTFVLHYEKYETDFDKTVERLMDFLELEPKGDLIQFIKGKEYAEYFTPEEVLAVQMAIKKYATKVTWKNLGHYFS